MTLSEDISTLAGRAAAKDREAEDLKMQVIRLRRQVNALQHMEKAREKFVGELEDRLEEYKAEIEELRKSQDRPIRIKTLQDVLRVTESKLVEAEMLLQSLGHCRSAREEAVSLKREAADLRKKLDVSLNRVDQLEKDILVYRQAIDRLRAGTTHAIDAFADAAQMREVFRKEVETLRGRINMHPQTHGTRE